MMPFIRIGHFLIPSFFAVISFGLSALLFFVSVRVEQLKKNRKIAFNIVLILMIAGFLGGRIFHIIYEEPAYYLESPWQVFAFWNGGFVFFGGLILSWLSVWSYCKWQKLTFLDWADFFAPVLSLGHAIGRLGCTMAGCCFGSYCSLPWAVDGRHPAPLYLMLAELCIFTLLMLLELLDRKKKFIPRPGFLFFLWLLLHCTVRFFVEYIRDDFRGSFWPVPGFGDLSVSQLISLILMLISIVQIFRITKNSVTEPHPEP